MCCGRWLRYVGLVTAACLAEAENHVACVDTDAQKVQDLTQGIIPFAQQVLRHFENQNGITLAIWGLAFKAKTDDVREAPALYCIAKFLEAGMRIKAYDPEAAQAAQTQLNAPIDIAENGYDALDGADALVIFTDWQEFRNPDLEDMAKRLKKPLIFDGRNLYDLGVIRKAGFEYHSIGRPSVTA